MDLKLSKHFSPEIGGLILRSGLGGLILRSGFGAIFWSRFKVHVAASVAALSNMLLSSATDVMASAAITDAGRRRLRV